MQKKFMMKDIKSGVNIMEKLIMDILKKNHK